MSSRTLLALAFLLAADVSSVLAFPITWGAGVGVQIPCAEPACEGRSSSLDNTPAIDLAVSFFKLFTDGSVFGVAALNAIVSAGEGVFSHGEAFVASQTSGPYSVYSASSFVLDFASDVPISVDLMATAHKDGTMFPLHAIFIVIQPVFAFVVTSVPGDYAPTFHDVLPPGSYEFGVLADALGHSNAPSPFNELSSSFTETLITWNLTIRTVPAPPMVFVMMLTCAIAVVRRLRARSMRRPSAVTQTRFY